jgi:mRNA interferase RelE/StbE
VLYKIVLANAAEKEYAYLLKTNKNVFERVRRALHDLAKDPHAGKPLKLAFKGKWSYRVGMYRIVYSIERNILTVFILDIGHRRDAYR